MLDPFLDLPHSLREHLQEVVWYVALLHTLSAQELFRALLKGMYRHTVLCALGMRRQERLLGVRQVLAFVPVTLLRACLLLSAVLAALILALPLLEHGDALVPLALDVLFDNNFF